MTHLVITRPPNFKFKPGDYVNINIPAIARNEWHPFTISSAPENDDALWVHVRGVGTWTKKLYDYFEEHGISEGRRRSVKRATITKKQERYYCTSLWKLSCTVIFPFIIVKNIVPKKR